MNRFFNKKCLMNVAIIIIAIIAIIFTLKLNISSSDIYYEFHFESKGNSIERDSVELQIEIADKNDEIPINKDLKSYVLNNNVKFPIENRALNNESFLLHSEKDIDFRNVKIDSVTVLEKNKNNFSKKGTLFFKDSTEGITYTEKGILLDKNISDQLSKIAFQNWSIKLFLCSIILVFVICFFFFRKNKYVNAFVILFFIIVSFFVLNSKDKYFFGKNYYYSYGEQKETILAPAQEFEQQFTVPKNNFSSVNFQLDFLNQELNEEYSQEEPELLLQLVNNQTNKIVDEKYIFYPTENSDAMNVSLSDNESERLEKGTSYQIFIKNISTDNQSVGLQISNETSDIIGESSDHSGKLALNLLFNTYPVKIVGMSIVLLTVISYFLIHFFSNQNRYKSFIIVGIYLIGLLIFGIQVKVEQNTIEAMWDPDAHISFVASLEATNTNILPDYRNQLMIESSFGASAKKIQTSGDLSGTVELVDGRVNYQGHPPLYHQILRLFGGVKKLDDKHVIINFTRLLTVSNVIVVLSISIWFVIGFLYIKREPIYHWLYVTLITSSSILIYGSSQLGNDVIGLLALGLTIFGLFGLSKMQYSFINYVTLALGICIALLTKVNVGLIVVITAVLYLIQKLLNKEYKILFNWNFLFTVPIYLIPAYFYLKMHAVFGVFMQSYANIDPRGFYNGPFYIGAEMRTPIKSISEFIYWFFNRLLSSYTAHPFSENTGVLVNICENLAQISLLVYFFVFLIKVKSWGNKWLILRYTSFATCIFLINLYLNTYNRYYQDGYPGGVQGRYMLHAIPVIALGITWSVHSLLDRQNKLYALEMGQEQIRKPSLSNKQISILFIIATIILYSGFLFPFILG